MLDYRSVSGQWNQASKYIENWKIQGRLPWTSEGKSRREYSALVEPTEVYWAESILISLTWSRKNTPVGGSSPLEKY